jgi:hypothetical protein
MKIYDWPKCSKSVENALHIQFIEIINKGEEDERI